MAETNPIKFLLNTGKIAKTDTEVTDPAFSITKVLLAASVIVGPLATGLVDWLSSGVNLTDGQYVTLVIALLAFMAILGAADVLGRSYVTARKSAQPDHVTAYKRPLAGHHGQHVVQVVGRVGDGDKSMFMVMEDGTLKIVPETSVTP